MADVPGKFFSATKVRTGVAPSSSGSIVGEPLPPVNPPGSSLNSVGLTMPSAFTVSNSPLTANGTIGVAGAGTVGQYIRGDGSLADFPQASGGGSSVSYYLNGSISQGTIGGVAYKELNKVPILGAGTQFSINADGYIASFLTDAGDPNLLEIPGGNWNFETYFSASSSGGTPTFYVELYKYDGTTFTLIASSSTSPELIAFGTNLNPYFSTLAVPTTTLALTDRLAVRFYVTHSGRTITMHTENNTLCQIVTTFTTGLTSLNGLTAQVQNLAVGTSGTDFNIASATATHTFNLPTASATNRGALSSADWSLFTQAYNDKINSAAVTGTTTKTLTLTQQDGGTITASWSDLNTDAVLSVFGRTGAVVAANGDYTTAQVTESGNLYYTEARVNANTNVAANTAARHNAVTLGTANGLSLSTQVLSLGLASAGVTGALSGTDWSTFNNKQNALNGTGFVKISGTTISYDNSTYLTTAGAASTYVPYTGATSGVDLGTYTLSASNLIANGGFNAGALLLKQSSNAQTIFLGYTAITPVGNNTLNFGFSTGSGVWKNFTLSSFLLTDNINRTYTLPDASGTIALVGGSGVGTVTSVAALTLGTSGTDLSSTVANGTTTPVITLNVPTASATNRGALSAADWTTFNNKQNALTNPVTGTGTTNYLPKFTGASTIGNSQIIEGTNTIGINTNGYTVSSGYTGVGINNATNGGALDLLLNDVKKGELYITSSSFNMYGFAGVGINLTVNNDVTKNLSIATTGNVLIGTTTDNSFKLDVNGTGRFSDVVTITKNQTVNTNTLVISNPSTSGAFAASAMALQSYNGSSTVDVLTISATSNTWNYQAYGANSGIIYAGGTGGLKLFAGNASGTIRFYTAGDGTGNERLTITSGGNVGIGTPSPNYLLHIAAGAANPQLQFTSTGTGSTTSDGFHIGVNNSTLNAFLLQKENADLEILTNDTQRMRITAAGRVLIGTPPPTESTFQLDVNGTGRFNGNIILAPDGTYGSSYITLGLGGTSNGSNRIFAGTSSSVDGIFIAAATGRPISFRAGGGTTDHLVIASSGTATFSSSVTATAFIPSGSTVPTNGMYLPATNTVAFSTNTVERMRIHQTTNGGYFKASNDGVYQNAGSTGSYHEINQSLNNTDSLVVSSNGNSSPYGMSVWFPNADPNNATNWSYAAFTGTNPFITIYKIFSNGTVAARSDARWKKNIETTRNGYIDDLCKLRVVKYNWYNHEDDAPKELGLIAQEVEEVFPNLINIEPVIAKKEVEQEDGTIIEQQFEDGVSRSIKTSVLPYMLLKAIQEQQLQIQELKNKLL